jgi:hypothetical protein
MLWVTGVDGHGYLLSDILDPGSRRKRLDEVSVSGLKSLMQQVQNVKGNQGQTKRTPED